MNVGLATLPPMQDAAWINALQWDANGLMPVIAQEAVSGDVLMFAWMNREALQRTVALKQAVYFSRSRQRLWHKGEESGHFQVVQGIAVDCDADVILLTVVQTGHEPGIACHTGRHSCFYRHLVGEEWVSTAPVLKAPETMYSK